MAAQLAVIFDASASRYRKDVLVDLVNQETLDICEPYAFAPGIRNFLSDMILESLEYRGHEWRSRGIDPGRASEEEIVRFVRPSLRAILSDAKVRARNDERRYLLLVDVIAAIAKRFCSVYPFCG